MDLYAKQIKIIVQSVLNIPSIEIILYGSRAIGNAHPSSDYDIALKSDKPIPPGRLGLIREKLENSNIPYKIDIVDYAVVSSELQANIDKDGIVW